MHKNTTIRMTKPSDHPSVIAALQNWWGGRDLTAMLPKLFLYLPDFCDLSCFAI